LIIESSRPPHPTLSGRSRISGGGDRATAPPGEPGAPGVAWVPDLAVNREGCLEIVRWFAWPADKGPPPRGVLGEDGIINAELQTQRNIERLVAGLFATLIRRRARPG